MNKRLRVLSAQLGALVAPVLSARAQFYAVVSTRPAATLSMAAGADTSEIAVYAPIGGWFGANANELAAMLSQITSPNLTVRVNSPGGDVFEAVAMFNLLRNHPARVTTHNDGLAASAASFLMMAGDEIVTEQGAMWMLHDASTETYGTAADHRMSADLLDKVSDNIAQFYAERMGLDVAEVRAILATGDTWYTGEEALEAGLTDRVNTGASVQDVSKRLSAWRAMLPEHVSALLTEQDEQDEQSVAHEQDEQAPGAAAQEQADIEAEQERGFALLAGFISGS